jgi:hypothetical protein
MKHGETTDPLLNQHKNFGFLNSRSLELFNLKLNNKDKNYVATAPKCTIHKSCSLKSDKSQPLENC